MSDLGALFYPFLWRSVEVHALFWMLFHQLFGHVTNIVPAPSVEREIGPVSVFVASRVPQEMEGFDVEIAANLESCAASVTLREFF